MGDHAAAQEITISDSWGGAGRRGADELAAGAETARPGVGRVAVGTREALLHEAEGPLGPDARHGEPVVGRGRGAEGADTGDPQDHRPYRDDVPASPEGRAAQPIEERRHGKASPHLMSKSGYLPRLSGRGRPVVVRPSALPAAANARAPRPASSLGRRRTVNDGVRTASPRWERPVDFPLPIGDGRSGRPGSAVLGAGDAFTDRRVPGTSDLHAMVRSMNALHTSLVEKARP